MLFVDVETTNLDPGLAEVIDLAIVDENDGCIFSQRIRPERLDVASEDALRIAGYSPEGWDSCPTFGEVAPLVQRVLANRVIAGHGVSYDLAVLRSNLRRHGVQEWNLRGPGYCTYTVSRSVLEPLGLRSFSLASVCEVVGVRNIAPHTARGDAEASLEVNRALHRGGLVARVRWGLRIREMNRRRKMSRREQAAGDSPARASQAEPAGDLERELREECNRIADMLVEKNRAYGNSALDPVRIFSEASSTEQLQVRIDDKLSRIVRGRMLQEDVVADLIGYLVLLRIAQRSGAK